MSSSKYTAGLGSLSGLGLREIGGKAVSLGRLIGAGFRVPDGFVVTTAAYREFLQHNDLETIIDAALSSLDVANPESVETCSEQITVAFMEASVPTSVAEEVSAMYLSTGAAVAVRSSATSEDLEEASFAGQMETYLNVHGVEDVLDKLKRCYAGLWTGRAISYRARNNVPQGDAEIAVVVQRLVDAKAAGVLFTLNPLSSDRSKMLVESNFGFGESVVSGQAAPDRYLVDRSGGLNVVSREIGSKAVVAIAREGGGVELVEASPDLVDASSLSDEEVLVLAEIGLRIEEYFGCPQDVEWAVSGAGEVYLLQSRPVTSVAWGDADDVVWTRGYSDDYWNDNVTPLFFELLGDHLTKYVNVELNEIMGYFKPGDRKTDQLLRLHKAHAYFNLEVLKRKVEYEIPTFLRNDDVLNYFPDGGGEYGKDTMRRLPFSVGKRVRAEINVRSRDPDGSSGRTSDAYGLWTREVFEPFHGMHGSKMSALEGRPLVEHLAYADEVDEIMVGHYRLVRYGIPVHNIGMNLLSQYLLKRFVGEEKARVAYPVMVSGLRHKTSETNKEIMALANTFRASSRLRNMILSIPSTDLWEALRSDQGPEAVVFMEAFDRFMEAFGCRGFTRELFYPRWGEAPEYVFDILKSLVADQGLDLGAVEERNRIEREALEVEIERSVKATMLGGVKWRLLRGVLDTARRYIIFREDQRYILDRWIAMNRELYLRIGSMLVDEGALSRPEDVFFLRKQEINDLVHGEVQDDVKSAVSKRREEFHRYENTTPPKFLQGGREFNDPFPPSSRSYKGIPASQGVLTAPVRVLDSIEDIWRVKAGEILVVPRTDPGWTPVFSKIGGLITEVGGVLSHGAVVSREYGVPAVTNIINACRIFRTGQVVTIDGATGTVNMDD